MTSFFQQDYFTLFAQPVQFEIDNVKLDQQYRILAAQVHPDRFASATDSEKRQALMLSTHVNTAYQTLKQPLQRARYLLSLKGIDTQDESNTSMPTDFLMSQMVWRESIDAAAASNDIGELERLSGELAEELKALQDELIESLDQNEEFELAALAVRKWQFLARLDEQIGDAIETLLD